MLNTKGAFEANDSKMHESPPLVKHPQKPEAGWKIILNPLMRRRCLRSLPILAENGWRAAAKEVLDLLPQIDTIRPGTIAWPDRDVCKHGRRWTPLGFYSQGFALVLQAPPGALCLTLLRGHLRPASAVVLTPIATRLIQSI
jgi:hypothetical protein